MYIFCVALKFIADAIHLDARVDKSPATSNAHQRENSPDSRLDSATTAPQTIERIVKLTFYLFIPLKRYGND